MYALAEDRHGKVRGRRSRDPGGSRETARAVEVRVGEEGKRKEEMGLLTRHALGRRPM